VSCWHFSTEISILDDFAGRSIARPPDCHRNGWTSFERPRFAVRCLQLPEIGFRGVVPGGHLRLPIERPKLAADLKQSETGRTFCTIEPTIHQGRRKTDQAEDRSNSEGEGSGRSGVPFEKLIFPG
jgi:hypothetical protein